MTPDRQSGGHAVRWQAAALTGDPEPLVDAGISERLAALLVHRGIRSVAAARAFLSPDASALHDPFLLPGAARAVARLQEARRHSDKIAIVGDYDVDGVTATALLVAVLRTLNLESHPILPERLAEGYGFQPLHVIEAKERSCQLIITADCGSTSVDAARAALDSGIDVIVTDHHLGSSADLPPEVIEVNPHRADSQYPFPSLSGAGVVFKLASALLAACDRQVSQEALLRIACLGTICDLVPLIDENRVIASKGLEALPRTRSVGLWSLMNRAAVEPPVTAVDVGFRIGPRINAAGRLASPRLALELLLTRDGAEARRLAEELDNLNRQRQQAEMAVVEDAEAKIRSLDPLPPILVAWSEHWHPGVLGIAAGRLARTFHRPTILLESTGKIARGSGRSIASVQLFDFLDGWRSEYDRFGGHAQAIGISVRTEALPELQRRWSAAANDAWGSEVLVRTLEYELELTPAEVDSALIQELERLQPFGVSNRRPLVKVGPLRPKGSPRLFGRGHLALKTSGPNSEPVHLLGWGWQDRSEELTGQFEALGFLETDRYTGDPALRLEDVRPVATKDAI